MSEGKVTSIHTDEQAIILYQLHNFRVGLYLSARAHQFISFFFVTISLSHFLSLLLPFFNCVSCALPDYYFINKSKILHIGSNCSIFFQFLYNGKNFYGMSAFQCTKRSVRIRGRFMISNEVFNRVL